MSRDVLAFRAVRAFRAVAVAERDDLHSLAFRMHRELEVEA